MAHDSCKTSICKDSRFSSQLEACPRLLALESPHRSEIPELPAVHKCLTHAASTSSLCRACCLDRLLALSNLLCPFHHHIVLAQPFPHAPLLLSTLPALPQSLRVSFLSSQLVVVILSATSDAHPYISFRPDRSRPSRTRKAASAHVSSNIVVLKDKTPSHNADTVVLSNPDRYVDINTHPRYCNNHSSQRSYTPASFLSCTREGTRNGHPSYIILSTNVCRLGC